MGGAALRERRAQERNLGLLSQQVPEHRALALVVGDEVSNALLHAHSRRPAALALHPRAHPGGAGAKQTFLVAEAPLQRGDGDGGRPGDGAEGHPVEGQRREEPLRLPQHPLLGSGGLLRAQGAIVGALQFHDYVMNTK